MKLMLELRTPFFGGYKMKKFLLGLLALASLSSFGANCDIYLDSSNFFNFSAQRYSKEVWAETVESTGHYITHIKSDSDYYLDLGSREIKKKKFGRNLNRWETYTALVSPSTGEKIMEPMYGVTVSWLTTMFKSKEEAEAKEALRKGIYDVAYENKVNHKLKKMLKELSCN